MNVTDFQEKQKITKDQVFENKLDFYYGCILEEMIHGRNHLELSQILNKRFSVAICEELSKKGFYSRVSTVESPFCGYSVISWKTELTKLDLFIHNLFSIIGVHRWQFPR